MSEMRTYTVTGMSCEHCETAVKNEVSQLADVVDVTVNASRGEASVSVAVGSRLRDEDVVEAIDEAGYSATRNT